MKKNYFLFFIIIFICFFNSVNAQNKINRINMDVFVDDDGAVIVEEKWSVFLDSDSEVFHTINNVKKYNVSNFAVKDDSGIKYSWIANWNPDSSFEDKKYKYGILEHNGSVDLSWGISNYGDNNYTISYKIENMIHLNSDNAQIMDWNFISKNFLLKPEYVYVKVYANKKFSDEVNVVKYGNYNGYHSINDGAIELYTESPLIDGEHISLYAIFPESFFEIANSNESVTSSTVVTKTTESNDNNKGIKKFTSIFLIAIFIEVIIVSPYILLQFLLIKYSGYTRSKKFLYKKEIIRGDVPYFRDLPCGKNIFRAYFIANEYNLIKNPTYLIGAILLKWIKENKIGIKPFVDSHGNIVQGNSLIYFKSKSVKDDLENILFQKLLSISEDGVIPNYRFSEYCKKNFNEIVEWFNNILEREKEALVKNKMIIVEQDYDEAKYTASDKLNEMAAQMIGLKNFYSEFSSLNEKYSIDVKLWEEHLMYAQLFGLANNVSSELKKVYPDLLIDSTLDDLNEIIAYSAMIIDGVLLIVSILNIISDFTNK